VPNSGWLTAYEWALIVAVAGQTVFLVVYGTRPWWKHYVGKALFFKSLALGLALWISLGNVVYPGYPHQIEIAVISIWLVAITIVGQCIALLLQVGHDRYEKKQSRREKFEQTQ